MRIPRNFSLDIALLAVLSTAILAKGETIVATGQSGRTLEAKIGELLIFDSFVLRVLPNNTSETIKSRVEIQGQLFEIGSPATTGRNNRWALAGPIKYSTSTNVEFVATFRRINLSLARTVVVESELTLQVDEHKTLRFFSTQPSYLAGSTLSVAMGTNVATVSISGNEIANRVHFDDLEFSGPCTVTIRRGTTRTDDIGWPKLFTYYFAEGIRQVPEVGAVEVGPGTSESHRRKILRPQDVESNISAISGS